MTQHPYFPQTPQQIEEMLQDIGVKSVEDLFADVPKHLRLDESPQLSPALTETELMEEVFDLITAFPSENSLHGLFPFGGGWEAHARPVLVDRLGTLPEFLTAYTPYQAEASQGMLQAIHEFQTMIARLLGCEIANASLYDGATALAEAAFMANLITRGRTKIIVSETVAPTAREVLATYMEAAHFELVTIPHADGVTNMDLLAEAIDDKTAAVALSNPNFFGGLEDLRPVAEMAHAKGVVLIAMTEPILLGVLEAPGQMGADIVVADGHSLGLSPFAGGDALGLFACKQEHIRRVPGRLVGLTKDTEGRTAYTLTLQTREQHIRRDKATSNICTNQGLNALRAGIFLACAGPEGMRDIGRSILGAASRALEAVKELSNDWEVAFTTPTAQSFVIRRLNPSEDEAPPLAGLPLGQWYPDLGDCYLVSASELTNEDLIAGWIEELSEIGDAEFPEEDM